MARAFHRVPPTTARPLSTSSTKQKWEGRQPEENTTRHKDSHNVQQDASREGMEEKAKGTGGSRATTEKSEGTHAKTKEEFPEAPDTIGMQDERGR